VYRYRIAGLTVSSDVDIPGLHAGGSDQAPADVAIAEGLVPDQLADAAASGPNWAMGDGVFLLRVPGIARFRLTGGRSIAYAVEPDAAPGDVAAFLTGTVFGILLHQRGLVVLHASGVSVGGQAALFMGPSGAGKSTLATALAQRGYPLVTDDFCVVGADGAGRPLVHPDGRLPKLWAHSIRHLDLAARQGAAVRGRLSKFYVEPPRAAASPEPLPCGPVYALREARGPIKPGIARPNVVDAALLLRNNAYRARLIRQMGQGELYFRLAAAIGNAGGVFQLTRELDFAAMPAVIDGLERHWAEIDRAAVAS
jgi:hypothetical protein